METTIFLSAVLVIIWLRGPLSAAAAAGERIADELRRIREMAEKRR